MIEAHIQLRKGSFELDVAMEFGREVTALYGHSGAGKTTVLQVIAGLERGTAIDRIEVRADNNVWQNTERFVPPHHRHVGYVFQRPRLFPHLSVAGNLEYARKRAASSAIDPSRIEHWLDLTPLLDTPVEGLSGGEAQRVAIARALLTDPACLLMDEPLGSIDATSRERILPYLARLREELKVPMVYVTHAMQEVTWLADKVYVLEKGRINRSGSVFDVSSELEAMNLGGDAAVLAECEVTGFDDHFELVEARLGQGTLYIASGPVAPGHRLRVRIPARDVSIALQRPDDSSILNIIPATVDDIVENTGHHSAMVRMVAGETPLLASITRKSLATLGLQQGLPVYAQIKGVALLRESILPQEDKSGD